MRKSKRTIKRFLDELAQVPNISLACKKTGISRQTLYRWKQEDPEFAKEIHRSYDVGIDSISDLAESKLVEKIQTGDFKSMKFWLENNNKRYLRPRKAIEHALTKAEDNTIPNTIIVKVFDGEGGERPITQEYE